MDGLDLSDLALFGSIAAAGSLAAAEVATGVPKATLSRSVLRLEETAGGAVFDRLPRGLRLTALGEALLPAARRAQEVRQEAVDIMRAAEDEPRGRVRVAATFVQAQRLVAPAMAKVLAEHSLVRLELVPRNDPVDVLTENFDLALTPFRPARPGVAVYTVVSPPILLFASPTLLAARGPVADPAGLRALGRVCVGDPAKPPAWRLVGPGGVEAALDDPPIAATPDPAAAAELAAGGRGAALLPGFVGEDLARAGRLAQVLPGWSGTPAPIYLSMPEGRGAVPAVRAAIEAIAARAKALAGG